MKWRPCVIDIRMSSEYLQAFQCGVEVWSGFWGDPLFSGALMMAIYAIAAVMVLRAARGLGGMERAAWRLAAVLLAFQVLNTPLDLHGLVWATGRCLAHIQGWHAERHAYQRELLVLLAITSCIVAALSLLLLRLDLLANGLLVLGLIFSFGMTLVKGINYHHLEALYHAVAGPLRVPELVELLGLACVLFATYLKSRRFRPP